MSEATVNCHQCGEIPVRSVEIWQSVTIGTRPVVLIDGSWGRMATGVYMDTNSDGFGAMCSRCQSEIDILDLPDGFGHAIAPNEFIDIMRKGIKS